MTSKSSSSIIPTLLFLAFMGIFFVSFVKMHQTKGTFWADETGVVSSSLTKGRPIKQIFYDAANTSQPSLDHIIREKIFVPLGQRLGVANRYPEFFHRLPALMWWLLPLSYFFLHFKDYSAKRRAIVILALSFLISSEFLRHYLAEARHYSAIPAVFTTMIILLMSDLIKLKKIIYQFLLISSLFPFLHLISFSYYLLFMAFFFYQVRKNLNLSIIAGYSVFIVLVLMMYAEIKSFSSPWQHPSINNLLGLHVIKSNIKWTLDWIFYGGILYPIYKYIPTIVKDNLLYIFAVTSLLSSTKFGLSLLRRKQSFITLPNLLLLSIVLVWPASIMTTLYFSGMFGGERYSITIMPITLFYISWLVVGLIWKIFSSDRTRIMVGYLLVAVSLGFLLFEVLPVNLYDLDTPDNQFVRQNNKLLKDKDAYLILDNGVYSAAFFPLAEVYRTPIKINYLQCRDGTFQTTGRNTLNDWLNEHKKNTVYLYSLRDRFMEPEKIVWQSGDFVLYRLTNVPEPELCQSPNAVGECYIKCISGEPIAPGGRSIRGVAQHLGVYRN